MKQFSAPHESTPIDMVKRSNYKKCVSFFSETNNWSKFCLAQKKIDWILFQLTARFIIPCRFPCTRTQQDGRELWNRLYLRRCRRAKYIRTFDRNRQLNLNIIHQVHWYRGYMEDTHKNKYFSGMGNPPPPRSKWLIFFHIFSFCENVFYLVVLVTKTTFAFSVPYRVFEKKKKKKTVRFAKGVQFRRVTKWIRSMAFRMHYFAQKKTQNISQNFAIFTRKKFNKTLPSLYTRKWIFKHMSLK